MLEELYAKFNVSRPDDFTGHSLSVSDIVALRQNGVVSCHYVTPHVAAQSPADFHPAVQRSVERDPVKSRITQQLMP